MKPFLAGSRLPVCFRIASVWGPALFLLLTFAGTVAAAQLPPMLQEEDCSMCHLLQLKTIQELGGKHATEVGCLDCHPQHPPEGEVTVSACSLCHEGKPHFQIEDCLQCHADPHKPLSSLRDPSKPARQECLSCHAEVGEQMQAAASRHATLYCTRCHKRHGSIPSCLDCHAPHLALQTDADCLRCHPAHRPLQVVPAGWVPAEFCQVCHVQEARNLAQTITNHGGINCVYCHQGAHPSTPSCQDCHGLPHDQPLHSRFRKCLNDCHGDAHRLISNP
jgi:hypothetical protein